MNVINIGIKEIIKMNFDYHPVNNFCLETFYTSYAQENNLSVFFTEVPKIL